MKKIFSSLLLLSAVIFAASAQETISIQTREANGQIIAKEIYGQFSEHLGSCIYGGIWVGKDSPIPNRDGYRLDVLNALKDLKIPVLRWPGGCFADDYHWMDGIGPQEKRTKISNNNWGGTLEDNSFGTHEFLNLCEILECEPYVCGNVGSGTPEEMAKWVEYMTSDSQSTIANLRRANGREKPWNVKYFGIGNEAWGCGGNMTPEYYGNVYNRYTTYTRDYGQRPLYKIASGANSGDLNWTEVMMKNVGKRMNAIGVHYYTVIHDWNHKGSATDFTDQDYYDQIKTAAKVEDIVRSHIAVMDRYDPENTIDLLVDEWGNWFDVEPGTNPGHLFQQNTMRDAMVAAVSLNIFHKYSYRVKMTNIAQVVNVLQSMILTNEEKMVLTPTYHVFEMYKPFQDSEFVPTYCKDSEVSVSAAKKDGKIVLAVANTTLGKDKEFKLDTDFPVNKVCGRILTSGNVRDYNGFDTPDKVAPAQFKGVKTVKGGVSIRIPAKSIVVLEID